jgi:hypothetical protein
MREPGRFGAALFVFLLTQCALRGYVCDATFSCYAGMRVALGFRVATAFRGLILVAALALKSRHPPEQQQLFGLVSFWGRLLQPQRPL